MKRTLLAIAIGAISAGLAGGALAQEESLEREENGVEAEASEAQEASNENQDQVDISVDDDDLPDEGDEAEDYQELRDDNEANGDDEANGDAAAQADQATAPEPEEGEVQADPGEQATSAQPAAGQAADDTGFEEVGPTVAELDDSIASLLVSEVDGMTIVNAEGETLGQVENVLRHEDAGDLHAVVSVGGFWIFGGSEVTLPLADMQLEGEQLVLQDFIGQDELDDLATDYDEERYSEVDGDMILAEAMEQP